MVQYFRTLSGSQVLVHANTERGRNDVWKSKAAAASQVDRTGKVAVAAGAWPACRGIDKWKGLFCVGIAGGVTNNAWIVGRLPNLVSRGSRVGERVSLCARRDHHDGERHADRGKYQVNMLLHCHRAPSGV